MFRRLWSLRREVLGAALYWSGIGRVFEIAARPDGAVILMYHSVAPDDIARFIDPPNRLPPDMFERQMEFLSKHRRVVPLSRVVEEITSGTSPTAGTVCITLDDGYRDNLTVAAPILERYRLPATLFLATGYVERGETQWADMLYWIFRHRTSNLLSIPSIGLNAMNLESNSQRATVYRKVHRCLLESKHDDRAQLLVELKLKLAPAGHPPRLTMNWNEVREFTRRYAFIEIGGHTRDHIDLKTHRGNTAHSQIVDCAVDLRREIGSHPRHFSFPYARWCAETRDMVSASGWKSGVGMGTGIRIGAASDRFAMPRVETPRSMTELRFKSSGAYPGVLVMVGSA